MKTQNEPQQAQNKVNSSWKKNEALQKHKSQNMPCSSWEPQYHAWWSEIGQNKFIMKNQNETLQMKMTQTKFIMNN